MEPANDQKKTQVKPLVQTTPRAEYQEMFPTNSWSLPTS